MLYGEVYATEIAPDCENGENCEPGRWITPIAMAIYLLASYVLLINLLIAVFNNIFQEVNSMAHQVWMFQRFTTIMEYEQKPILPPPFIVISHIYLLLRFLLWCVSQGNISTRVTGDNGLKLFLEEDDKERLCDFEEDCVDGYLREKELKSQMSSGNRIKTITDWTENANQRMEDIEKINHHQNSLLQVRL